MTSNLGVENTSTPWTGVRSSAESPRPLGREVQGGRSPLTSRRQLIEALNDELESMESSEIQKCRLYKIALVIVTIIGLAVSFIVPISMFFGIPMWIPVVLGLGAGLITSVIGNKLRNKCNTIRLKYRALQVYRQQLLSQHPSLSQSTLHKYGIELPRSKQGLKEKIMQQANLGGDTTSDGGATLDASLDFAGDWPKRYQTDALIGLNTSPTLGMWSKYINAVGAAKLEILSGRSGSEAIDAVKRDALLEEGVDPERIPPGSFIDLAKTIMGVCGFGARIGVEARRAFDQYERSLLHSKTWASWSPSLSGVTKKFFLQGASTLDFASKTFEKLSRLVKNQLSAKWLPELEKLTRLIFDSVKEDTIEANANRIEELCHKLSLHEACDEARLKLLLGVAHTVSAITKKPEVKQSGIERLTEAHKHLVDECKKIRTRAGGLPSDCHAVVEAKAERALIESLVSLGDLDKFVDKIRGVVQFGRSASYDIYATINKFPERVLVSLKGNLEQIEQRLRSDGWGAISGKSFEEIMKEKTEIIETVQQVRKHLGVWETQYKTFKETKLSRILLADFGPSFKSFEELLAETKDFDSSSEEIIQFLKNCETFLRSASEEEKAASGLQKPTEEELAQWAAEYSLLTENLSSFKECLQAIYTKTQDEGVSKGSLLASALTTKEKTLDDNLKKKEAEFKAKAQALREETRQKQGLNLQGLIQEGIRGLDEILAGMMAFEGALKNPKDLQTNLIIESSSKLFGAMHAFSSSSFLNLQESLKAHGIEGSEEDISVASSKDLSTADRGLIASAVHAQKTHNTASKARHEALEGLLKSLQKTLGKWNLAQAIVSGILGLIAMALGIAFISTHIVWIVLGICILSVFMRVVPLVLDHFMEKRVFDVRVIEVAKKFSSATKILPSEFDNEDVKRLAVLQDTLQLEGFEKSWAQEVITDLDGTPGKKAKGLKKISRELRSDAKKISARIKKRFNKGLSDRVPSASRTEVKDAVELAVSADALLLQDIEKKLEALEAQEDGLISERLRLCSDQKTFESEKAYSKSLEKRVREGQEPFRLLEQEAAKKAQARKILLAAIQKAPKKAQVSIDVAKEIKVLNKLSQTIYRRGPSAQEKDEAKKQFKELVLKIASEGNFVRLEAELEIGACLGSCQARLRDEFEEKTRKIRLYEGKEAEAKAEAVLEGQEEILKISGLLNLAPFARFSSGVGGSGRVLAEEAKQRLQLLSTKLQSGDVVDARECSRALAALSSYLQKHEALESLAYGIPSGEARYREAAGLMQELYAAEQILSEGIEMNFGHCCETSLQRARSVMRDMVRESAHIRLLDDLFNLVGLLKNEETSQEESQKKVQEFLKRVEGVPIEVLQQMCRELDSLINSLGRRAREYQDISNCHSRVSEHVRNKEEFLGDTLRLGAQRLGKIQEELLQIEEKKAELLQEKKTLLKVKTPPKDAEGRDEDEDLLDLRDLFRSKDSE